MLSSIHPLGERARRNRWSVTIASYTIGSTLAGAAVGAVLGWTGALLGRPTTALVVFGVAAIAAGTLDLSGVKAPGPRRQVNERWIGALRGWVYGGGFGVQLGAGVATYVVTWAVWTVFLAEVLSGSAVSGATVGAVFGLGRALAPIAAGRIDRPSRLTSFSARMAAMARPTHLAAGVLTVALGAAAVVIGV